MATRIKISIDAKSKVVFTSGGDASTLVIQKATNGLNPWSIEQAAIAHDGKWGSFPQGPGAGLNRENIEIVRIIGSEKELKKIQRLIFLKDDVKATKSGSKGFTFEIINLKHDLRNNDDYWNVDMPSTLGGKDGILNLTAADFNGDLTAENIISIDDTNYDAKVADNTPEVVVPRNDDQKKALLDLEEELANLETKYPSRDWEEGTNFDLADVSDVIGTFSKPGDPGKGLKSYFFGNWDTTTVKKENDNIKHIIFNLKEGGGNRIYEDAIGIWINFLIEVGFLHERGITKKTEVAKIFANGFDLEDDCYGEFEKTTGRLLYKGFPVIDPNQTATPGATETDRIKVTAAKPRYTKTAIDIFRHQDNFPNEDSKAADNINFVADDKVLDPRNCWGFVPGDTDKWGKYHGHAMGLAEKGGGSHDLIYENTTKLYIDILTAPTLDEAIDLAFFGIPHKNMAGGENVVTAPDANKVKKDPRYNKSDSNCLLFFNERGTARSEEEMIDDYWNVLKQVDAGENIDTYTGTTGNTDWNTTNYNSGNADTVKKIDDAHTLVKNFWAAYKVARNETEKVKKSAAGKKIKNDYNVNGTTEDQKNRKKLYDHWEDKINTLITGTPQNDLQSKLSKAKNDYPQKEYEELWKNANGKITKDNVDGIIKLVEALKDAYDAATDDKKKDARKKLKKYAEAANNTKEKKIWDIINEHKKDGEALGTKAWNKVKNFKDDNDLATAQQNLKNAIKNILGKEDNAVYDKIVEGISTSATDINEVANILNKAKEGEGENSGSNKGDGIWRKLNEWKNNNTKIWNAANKLKKAGDTENYPEKIWKQLKKAADDTNELVKKHKVNEAKTKNDVDAAKAGVENDDDYKNSSDSVQKYFKEKIFPRKYLAVSLYEKNNATNEEQELAKLVDFFAEHYSLDATEVGFDDEDENGLAELETRLNKLKKYKEGSGKEKTKVYDNLTTNEQIVVNVLFDELGKKVKKMRDKQKKQEKNKKQNTEPSFWKTPPGYLTAAAIVLVVIGGIAYLIKTNSSEEGEGE